MKLTYIAYWVAVAVFLASVQSPAHGVQLKAYYKSIPEAHRRLILGEMKVMDPEDINKNSDVDFAEFLTEACGMEYVRDAAGIIQRPSVECTYHPKSAYAGMSNKFQCSFVEGKNRKTGEPQLKKRKVKYDLRPGGGDKEIAQAIVGSGIGKLMGFMANTYCPARVICLECPSDDPWVKNQKSSEPALRGNTVIFESTVVERKVKGYEIMVVGDVPNRPSTIKWEELKFVSSDFTAEQQLQELINRETWMLYVQFLNHADADPHNNGFVCAKSSTIVEGKSPDCTVAYGFQHDWGNSLNFMNLERFKSLKTFGAAPGFLGYFYSPAKYACTGKKLPSSEGVINYAKFSEESRRNFLSLFSKITRQQLIDLFSLAQVELTSLAPPEDWVEAINSKINEVSKATCRPIQGKNAQDSVLIQKRR